MSGLQRSSSRMNLQANLDNSNNVSEANKSGLAAKKGSGLRRTTSRPNLLGSNVNLKQMADEAKETQNLSLRRTGSKMSIADLGKPKANQFAASSVRHDVSAPSLAPSAVNKERISKEQDDEMAIDDSEDDGNSPPISITNSPASPAMPKLHRSRSMNQLEAIREPTLSEGQKAVESISGKVELMNLDPPSLPSSRRSSATSSITGQDAESIHSEFSATHNVDRKGHTTANTVDGHNHSKPGAYGTFTGTESDNEKETVSPSASSTSSTSTKYATSAQHSPSSFVPKASPLSFGQSPRDDGSLKPEAGERVDYFSHDWNESDIAGSWRYIINRKQDMANSARLENASWRMWAKAKYHLKTVDPSTVNWMKDYDVTWLYGPSYHDADEAKTSSSEGSDSSTIRSAGNNASIQRANENIRKLQSSPSHSNEGSPSSSRRNSPSQSRQNSLVSVPALARAKSHTNPGKPPVSHLKSILKKKSLAQLMSEEVGEYELAHNLHNPQTTSQVRSTANYLRHHHYRPTPQGQSRQIVADILNRQYRHNEGQKHNEGSSAQDYGSSDKASSAGKHFSSRPTLENADAGHLTRQEGSVGSFGSLQSVDSQSSRGSGPTGPYRPGTIPASIYTHQGKSSAMSRSSSRSSSARSSQASFNPRSRSLRSLTSDSYRSLEGRHVRFNDRVEQCIAVEPDAPEEKDNDDDPRSMTSSKSFGDSLDKSNSAIDSYDEEDEDEDEDDEEDDDSGGGLFLGLRRSSMVDRRDKDSQSNIISTLPATTLKQEEDEEESGEDENEFVVSDLHRSPSTSSSRRPGFNAQYTPHPVQTYEIVDPEIHPVKFEAHGVPEEQIHESKVEEKRHPDPNVDHGRSASLSSAYDHHTAPDNEKLTTEKPKRRIMPTASFG